MNMRRYTLLLLAVVVPLLVASVAADSQPLVAGRLGQFWGTWIWQTQIAPGMTLPALITFAFDGTITGADSSDGMPNTTTRMSPMHGVWERTGRQSIGGTSVFLVYNAQTGVVSAIGRARSSLQFANDFNKFQGTMFVEIAPCPAGPASCPDPTNPTVQWVAQQGMPPDGFAVSGTRLERVAAGPLLQ